MKKRVLSVLLVVSMLLTLVPSAFADGLSEGTVATIGEAEFTSLQDAIDETAKAEGTYEIKLVAGVIEESVTIVQKAGVYLTITGAPEGTTLKGMITVDGQSTDNEERSLTIDGVDIEATGEYCIYIPSGGSRYSKNLTVKNCDFTGEGAVGIKQSTGGCSNWLIQNCSADETMHSLVQAVNVKGLVIDGCTVRSKNGINLNSSSDVEIKNSTVEVRGYAVRAGVATGGSSGAVTLTENTLKTDNSEGDAVVVLRGNAATEIELNMEENIVSGETHISGTVEETDITADNNYWDGEEDPIVSGAAVDVGSYYVDEELTEAVGDPDLVVARIGNKFYKTIQAAIDEAQPGDTVKLLDNYSNYKMIKITKSITLDLNGYNINRTFGGIAVDITDGDVVITGNGKISGSTTGVSVAYDAALTLEEGVIVEGRDGHGVDNDGKLKIDGATITATEYGVALYSGDEWAASLEMLDGSVSGAYGVAAYAKTNVTVKGGTISGTVAGLSGEGGSHGTTFNVEGGTIQSEDGVGIYHPQNGKLNISGGTVSGATGINMKSGELNITGGTIKGNGEKADYSFVGGGFNCTGDALVIESCGYPGGAPKATITGGTFESENATAVASYAGNNVTETVTDFVSGGTYSDDSAESYLADGYALKLNSDGTYGLIKATPEEIEEKAAVTFNVTPADAVVKVEKDGEEFCGIDSVYELLGGTYTYTVSKEGYYAKTGSFTVAGEEQSVDVELIKIAYYTVTYTDGVEDAEIFADQSFTVAENTATPVFEGTVARDGYTFKGWTPAVAATVTADATYVAVFEKIPEEPKEPVFEDVSADAYYADAVVWAAKNKVTTGVEEGVFAPEAMCTRAQVVTFLWRAAGSPKASADTKVSFTDIKEGSFYYDAVVWAVENGITNGVSATEFAPDAVCTRAQVATFLWRAAGEPKAEATMNFKDVEAGAYYYDAVLWAAANGITNGISATEFAPAADCTRAQAITLVYRAF